MLRKNKWRILISSLVVLLPMLFGLLKWNALPESMITHWGADNVADRVSGKAFAVFGLPLILLALHFVCIAAMLLDRKQREQNAKALGIIFWILPVLSLFASASMYRTALGGQTGMAFIAPAILGLAFLFIGNYLPKVKQNSTLGIKVYWALNNTENWNRTHRFGGKVWFMAGCISLLSILLPLNAMIWVDALTFAAALLAPITYSYCVYRQHRRAGIAYAPSSNKVWKGIVLCVILVAAGILMSTGSVRVQLDDTFLCIEATYWDNLQIDYADIDSVEYRDDFTVGVRASGFGSPRLSMGSFENSELGAYTLYAYMGTKEFVVLTANGQTLAIGLQDAKETQAVYEAIAAKIAERSLLQE